MSDEGEYQLDAVDDAITAIAAGDMVVVVDDDDRENEGDLIMAASKATPEQMGFIVRHTSGIVCAPITSEDARRLHLNPMVADNDAPMSTAFTVSVDYKNGLTTGISAEERCNTVRALANDNIQASDFVRPGHVFPLIAKRGGVLMRSGHTEAAVDLAKLAKLPPVGVIGELVNDNGTVKKGIDVHRFARQHNLKIISVNDIISYRQAREKLVERRSEFTVSMPIGPAAGIAYATPFDSVQHLAVVFGGIGDGRNVPVRLHREDLVEDVFGDRETLNSVYDWFKQEGRGVLVYLRTGASGVPAETFSGDEEPDEAHESVLARANSWRDVGLGAQILRDLNVSSIRLLATRDRHYVGLAGFGIEIEETELIEND